MRTKLCAKLKEYHHGHKCVPSTQLQLIEDLLQLLEAKSETEPKPEEMQFDSDEEGLMHLSECATVSTIITCI